MSNEKLFHAGHYNIIAAQIKKCWPTQEPNNPNSDLGRHLAHFNETQRATLTDLAVSMCKRFKEDNPNFDPIMFLDKCSPDPELYPLSELWDES